MIRYLKQYKLLLFLTVLFTAISSLSYVFIAILLQQVMDIVDMSDMDGFIRILLFSLIYFALKILSVEANKTCRKLSPQGSKLSDTHHESRVAVCSTKRT